MILVSCNGSLPAVPDIDLCGAIDTGNIATDYVYCRGYVNRNRKYRFSAREAFQKRMIMISPQHYGDLNIYINEMKRAAQQHCQ